MIHKYTVDRVHIQQKKIHKILLFMTMWMNLEDTLSKISQSYKHPHLHMESKKLNDYKRPERVGGERKR
jgi:hypothetical protein